MNQTKREWAALRRLATAMRSDAWELPAKSELRVELLAWALIIIDPERGEAISPGGIVPDSVP